MSRLSVNWSNETFVNAIDWLIDYRTTGAISAGDVIVFSWGVGVAGAGATGSGHDIPVAIRGRAELPKASGWQPNGGDPCWWDPSASKARGDAAVPGCVPIGCVLQRQTATGAGVWVNLLPGAVFLGSKEWRI